MPSDVDWSAPPDAQERLAQAWAWINDFPVNPHPDLGRTGAVCPYMGRALRRKYVELVAFDARSGDDACVAELRRLREKLKQRSAELGNDAMYLVYFLVPYGLSDEDMKAMMQRVHARLRPEFVQNGMLAGDFWPGHEAPGLHSPTFRPFASPFPLFPIRNMIPADLPFFAGSHVPAQTRLEYLSYYQQFFGDALPKTWRQRLDEALQRARADAAAGPVAQPVPAA
ncbi:MAG TPA: hypothetical protein VKZ67_03605 [Natronosporangium sp.]|nr:hypothetical protein [Natronosporangium sp.]